MFTKTFTKTFTDIWNDIVVQTKILFKKRYQSVEQREPSLSSIQYNSSSTEWVPDYEFCVKDE